MSGATISHDLALVADGKAAKLRASCDACNESKVRCSQTKPTCSRCEKQGALCVYGLSRRSHKSAPRVGASYSSISTASTSSSQRRSTSSESDGRPGTANATRDCTSVPIPPHQADETIATGSSMLSSMDLLEDFNPVGFDFANFGSHGSLDTLSPLRPTLDHDLFDHQLSLPSPDSGSSYTARMLETRPGSSSGCNCISRVATELLSIPLLFNNESASFDVQLSQLKRAIQLSQDSVRCNCITDEMTIMTISILVGRIIQGFETMLTGGSPLAGSSPSTADSFGAGTPNVMPPKLSWGVLQIEDDDEDKLKQHLWLLHFQKLERLLKQFSESVRLMRSMQGASNSAHVMACECIHMWLEQRAQIVRDKFVAQNVARSGVRVYRGVRSSESVAESSGSVKMRHVAKSYTR